MSGQLSLERVLTIERLCDRTRRRGAFGWRADVKVALVLLITLLNVGLALPPLSGGLLAVGGDLSADSRPGQGTRMRVRLPRCAEPPLASATGEAALSAAM